jgi:predicted alpha/beta-fold hydrolase
LIAKLHGSDEGTITIDWAFPPDPPAGGPPAPAPTDVPTVVIFPGLAGHSGKDYIRSIAARVTRFLHARVCILNWRGFNCKLTSHKARCPPPARAHVRLAAPHTVTCAAPSHARL